MDTLEKGKALKEQGNTSFKTGDFQEALKHYHMAVMHVKGLDSEPLKALVPGSTVGSTNQEAAKTLLSLYLNISMCHLKLEHYEKAVDYSTKVLDKEEQPKALFRRGVAKSRLGEIDAAERDLRRAYELAPTDKGIHDALQAVLEKQKERSASSSAAFRGMFK